MSRRTALLLHIVQNIDVLHAQAAVAFTLAPKSAKVNKAPFLPRKILSSVTAFACSAEINRGRSSLLLMFSTSRSKQIVRIIVFQ